MAAGAGAALVLCCVGHTLLLAFGVAGLGAAVGALTGTTAVLIAAGIALTATGALVGVRRRRRPPQRPRPHPAHGRRRPQELNRSIRPGV